MLQPFIKKRELVTSYENHPHFNLITGIYMINGVIVFKTLKLIYIGYSDHHHAYVTKMKNKSFYVLHKNLYDYRVFSHHKKADFLFIITKTLICDTKSL